MWWEHVAELAYKMALDCGQAHDFFEYIDELSQHNASHQKMSSQTAMSTLLGNDWRNHRKRGRDPIRRISSFNGLLDDNGHGKEGHPESVLVKRSKHHEPTLETIRPRSLSPMSILRNTPVDLDEQRSLTPNLSRSPVQLSEKLQLKPAQKEALRLPYQKVTSNLSQQKSKSTLPKTTLKPGLTEMTSLKPKSPEKKTRLVDERKSREDARDDEKKPIKSPVRTGKPGVAEKKRKAKKRRSSSSKADKEYVVNRLKDVKENESGELVYLVEWEGNWDDTWEPFHCICHLGQDIKEVYKKTSQEMQAAMRLAGHLEDVDSD